MTEIVKVIRAEEVEVFTAEGWKLTEVLETSETVTAQVCVKPAGPDSTGYYRPAEYCEQTHVVSRPLFVVRKNDPEWSREKMLEERITGQAQELLRLDELVRETDKAFKLSQQVAKDLAEQKVTAEVTLERIKRELTGQQLMNDEHVKLLNLIRKEAGEAKWREWQGDHTSCVHCIANQK